MIASIKNNSTLSEALKSRKAHLADLLKVMDIKAGKSTVLQALTIGAIKAEMEFLEHQLKTRR